ncbi:DNA repair protein RecO [Candidatus Saccharibacteria bacterium]|nr:DNA repair protein RecO [Candidatus Saccharibacteria bacterium]
MQNEIKTKSYVLRRTNYGEADRILNLITSAGKISAIAKGVRKEKSKLAGSVEMFSLTELTIHKGKGEFGTITSAKMLRFYENLLKDYNRMELASMILKKISLAAEHSDSPKFFEITDESLKALNDGVSPALVEAWFLINLTKETGEDINLYRDAKGEKLSPDENYVWDVSESAFCKKENGEFGVDEIKMLRLMMTNKLEIAARVKDYDKITPLLLKFARIIAKQ